MERYFYNKTVGEWKMWTKNLAVAAMACTKSRDSDVPRWDGHR
jgi:hypothetical protein